MARHPEPFVQGCLVCPAYFSVLGLRPGPSERMSTLRVSDEQSRCPHPTVTFGGSNQHQTRVKCAACGQTLMLLYHSLRQRHVDEVLRRRVMYRGDIPLDHPWTGGQALRGISPDAHRRTTQSAPSSPGLLPPPVDAGPAPAPAPAPRATSALRLSEVPPVLAPDDGWCTPLSSPRELQSPTAPTACKWCHQKPSWNGEPEQFCSTVCRQEAEIFETTA
jgi:hypothetical protein